MAKYHINGKGEAKSCTASKRPCRFAAEDHFPTEAAAIKASEDKLAKEFDGRETKRKKRVLPETIVAMDPDSWTVEQRADLMIFDAMKLSGDLLIGATDEDNFYGSGQSAVLTEEEIEELADHGVKAPHSPGRGAILGNGIDVTLKKNSAIVSVDVVPGTLTETATSHFAGTMATDNDTVIHLEAQAVVTFKDGHRMPVPVTCPTSFQDVLSKAIANTPEKVIAARAANSLSHG